MKTRRSETLRTTTHNSDRDAALDCGGFGGFRRARAARWALVLVCTALMTGCARSSREMPTGLFLASENSAAHKADQTRRFETPSSDELLSASAAVLQDLGFQITESDRSLGFLRAAKERSAREYGQEVTRVLVTFLSVGLSVLAGGNSLIVLPVDLHQQINASLIAESTQSDDTHQQVRIVFYRLVWRGSGISGDQRIPPGQQKMEMIRDPLIYQQFYARLSKAVFLEAQKI